MIYMVCITVSVVVATPPAGDVAAGDEAAGLTTAPEAAGAAVVAATAGAATLEAAPAAADTRVNVSLQCSSDSKKAYWHRFHHSHRSW
jgi:hypothetical protein